MAYTVKQVAAMSGVSVRTLHFYDETALLKPAYTRANGYRIYEEPQLLLLQQILFYRELGFELKEIKRILDRADFENVAALEQLPAIGAYVVALPMKIQGGSGGPLRIVAWVAEKR